MTYKKMLVMGKVHSINIFLLLIHIFINISFIRESEIIVKYRIRFGSYIGMIILYVSWHKVDAQWRRRCEERKHRRYNMII